MSSRPTYLFMFATFATSFVGVWMYHALMTILLVRSYVHFLALNDIPDMLVFSIVVTEAVVAWRWVATPSARRLLTLGFSFYAVTVLVYITVNMYAVAAPAGLTEFGYIVVGAIGLLSPAFLPPGIALLVKHADL